MDLKNMVKDGKKAKFVYFKNEALWYVTEDNFLFPVPVSDIGPDTRFLAEERAMALMKYIRKELVRMNPPMSELPITL